MSSYFGSLPEPSMQQSSFSAQPYQQQMNSIPQQSCYQPAQQQQQQQQHFFGQDQRSGSSGGGMAETAPYLQGFNLLAEAAKRAEMACLMRDLEDFEMWRGILRLIIIMFLLWQ
jgi:hypothetical protein